MNASAFEISDALGLTEVDIDNVSDLDLNRHHWIDLTFDESGELDVYLEHLGIEGTPKRICLEANDRAGFYAFSKTIVFVLPTHHQAGEIRFTVFVCRPDSLVTLNHKTSFGKQCVDDFGTSTDLLPGKSVPALVSLMLLWLSLVLLQRVSALRRTIQMLEERIDRDADDVDADQIWDARSRMLPMADLACDCLPVAQSLCQTENALFPRHDCRDHFNYALVNFQAAFNQLERMDERIDSLHVGFQMNAQEKTNRRLGRLTTISAIFMPVTLLAGIWGMNFENMPELMMPLAYPAALACMVTLGGGLFFFFRLRGWLD